MTQHSMTARGDDIYFSSENTKKNIGSCLGLSNFYNWYLSAGIESVRGCEEAGKRLLSRSTCAGPINFPCIFIFWICWWQFVEYQHIREYSGHATRSACLVSHLKCKSQVMNWGEIEADMIEEFRVGESQSSRVTTSNESLGVQTGTNLHVTGSRASGAQQLLPASRKKEESVDAVGRWNFFSVFNPTNWNSDHCVTVIQSVFRPQTPANVFQLLTRQSHLSISELFARLLFAELQLDAADLNALRRQKEEGKK